MPCDGVFAQLFQPRTPRASAGVFTRMFDRQSAGYTAHVKGYYAFVQKAIAAGAAKPSVPAASTPAPTKGPRFFDPSDPNLPPPRSPGSGSLRRYKMPVASNAKPAAPEAPATPEPAPAAPETPSSGGVFSRLFSKKPAAPATGDAAAPASGGVFSRLFGKKPTASANTSSPNVQQPASESSSAPAAPAPAAGPNPHIHTPQFKAWFGDWHGDPASASKVVHQNTGEPLETHHIEDPPAPGYAHEPKPKVVYHGNPRGLVTEFKKEWNQKNPDALHFGPGFYFTEDEEAGKMYAHGATGAHVENPNPAVGSYYLKVHNPFDADRDTIDPSKLPAVERNAIRANIMQKAFMAGDRSEALQVGRDFDAGHIKLKYNELTDDKGVGGYGVSKSAIAKHLQELGHDGITVVGPDSHPSRKGANRFWITFEPNQVKSTANEGTFDANQNHTMKGYVPSFTKAITPGSFGRHKKPKLPNMTPTAMATAVAILHARGEHAEADFLMRHLPPAHSPIAGRDPAVPYAADIESPDPNVDTPPPKAGGLPAAGVPQPANPAGRGSLPPKLGTVQKAFDPTSPLDWMTNYPDRPAVPPSFPVASVPAYDPAETPHRFGYVYLLMPPAVAERVTALGRQIPDYDLADDGREECVHATCLYGIHSPDPLPVYEVLSHFRPAKLTLGAVSVFPGDDYDVVKIDVESESLHRMNLALRSLPHTNKFRDYIPHVTIAYVKPGMGAVYAARFGTLDLPCVAGTAVFSDASKTKHVVPLGRVVRVEKAAMSYLDSGSGGALVGPGGMLSSLTKQKRNRKALARVCKSYLDELGVSSLGEAESHDAFDAEEFVFGTKAMPALITKPTAPAVPKPAKPVATAPPTPKPAPPPGRISSPNEPAQPAAPATVHPRVKALTDAAAKIPVGDDTIVQKTQGNNGRFTTEHTLDKWGRDEHGMRAHAFKTSDGNKFVMRVTARDGPAPGMLIHQLDFHDQNGNFHATGKSSTAPEVFSKVSAAGHALIAKTKPPVLYFSAARDGSGANPESRQRLYGTLTKMLSSANPDYAALAVADSGGTKSFYVVRRDKLAAMKEHLASGGKEVETLVKSYDPEFDKAFNPREPRDNFGKWSKNGRQHNPHQPSLFGDESEPKSVAELSATAYNTGDSEANSSGEGTMKNKKLSKAVTVSPGNRLIMGTSAPSYSYDGEKRPTEFHYTSEDGRWHVREGNGGTMILTDRHHSHPTNRHSMQGVHVVKGKIPEVEAKIEELTRVRDGKSANPIARLDADGETRMEDALRRAAGSDTIKDFVGYSQTEENMPIESLVSPQTVMGHAAVDYFRKNPDKIDDASPLPLVILHGGKNILRDGNSRTAAAMRLGRTHIKARVVYVPE